MRPYMIELTDPLLPPPPPADHLTCIQQPAVAHLSSEPCPTLPFMNMPPCQSNRRCCFRQILGLWYCSRKGGPCLRHAQVLKHTAYSYPPHAAFVYPHPPAHFSFAGMCALLHAGVRHHNNTCTAQGQWPERMPFIPGFTDRNSTNCTAQQSSDSETEHHDCCRLHTGRGQCKHAYS